MAAAKSTTIHSFLWKLLDRVMFIGIGALGAIVTTYITGILKVSPPELVVRQTYNRVEGSAPKTVGKLMLSGASGATTTYGVLRIDFENEGRGVAKDVRFQAKFPKQLNVEYHNEPDLKVYKPSKMDFAGNEFYAEFPKLPIDANDWIAFRVVGDAKLLCDARVKFVSEDYEGEVETIAGIKECR